MLSPQQKEAIAKLTRQSFVIGIYRWLIEVAFLFAAFNAFPDYKWPIGLAVLAFSAGVSAIVHVLQTTHQIENVMMDAGERKTRHAIVRAAELAAGGVNNIDQLDFWSDVNGRVEQERRELYDTVEKPTGAWKGFALATGALLWQLAASLFGIALVAALTAGY